MPTPAHRIHDVLTRPRAARHDRLRTAARALGCLALLLVMIAARWGAALLMAFCFGRPAAN